MSALLTSVAFVDLQRSIANAKDTPAVDRAVSLVWQSHGAGHLTDNEAQALSDLAQERRVKRSAPASSSPAALVLSRFKPRRRQCSPDKLASRDRRRQLGGPGAAMTVKIGLAFTEGERAALTIIAGEVKHHGQCDLPIDKIAALAGCGRTTVQNAVHEARRLGLIKVIERPQRGRKSLTNIVVITSSEWLTWLRRGPTAHRPIGSKRLVDTSKILNTTKNTERRKNPSIVSADACSLHPSGNVAGLREERVAAVAQRGASWR